MALKDKISAANALNKKLKDSLKNLRLKTSLLIVMLSAVIAGCRGQEVKIPPIVPSPQQKQTIELINQLNQESHEKREEVGSGINEIEAYLKNVEAILNKENPSTNEVKNAESMLLAARKKWASLIKQNPGLTILINYLHQTINIKQDILEYKQIMKAMEKEMKSLDELNAMLKTK